MAALPSITHSCRKHTRHFEVTREIGNVKCKVIALQTVLNCQLENSSSSYDIKTKVNLIITIVLPGYIYIVYIAYI